MQIQNEHFFFHKSILQSQIFRSRLHIRDPSMSNNPKLFYVQWRWSFIEDMTQILLTESIKSCSYCMYKILQTKWCIQISISISKNVPANHFHLTVNFLNSSMLYGFFSGPNNGFISKTHWYKRIKFKQRSLCIEMFKTIYYTQVMYQ